MRKPHTSAVIYFGYGPRKFCFHLLSFLPSIKKDPVKICPVQDASSVAEPQLQYKIDFQLLFLEVPNLPLSIFSPVIASFHNLSLPKFICQSSASFSLCRQVCLYAPTPVTENIWIDSFCCTSSESTVCLTLAN